MIISMASGKGASRPRSSSTRGCRQCSISLIGRIPYDEAVIQAMVRGNPVTAISDGPVTAELRRIWRAVVAMLGD